MLYVLGSNGKSFIVGFGDNYPKNYRHKASHCPDSPKQCLPYPHTIGVDQSKLIRNITLFGAMVGGPGKNDDFKDDPWDEQQSSVALDYNAGFQTALIGILDFLSYGVDRPKLSKPGKFSQSYEESSFELSDSDLDKKDAYTKAAGLFSKFYQIQKSGMLSKPNWRRPAGLLDGDGQFSGGFFDSSGTVKYTHSICNAFSKVAWGMLDTKETFSDYDGTLKQVLRASRYIKSCYRVVSY